MATAHQIDIAAAKAPSSAGDTFTDKALVPDTLQACVIPTDHIAVTLRYIARVTQGDPEERMFLLAAVLGEG